MKFASRQDLIIVGTILSTVVCFFAMGMAVVGCLAGTLPMWAPVVPAIAVYLIGRMVGVFGR